MSKRFKPQDYSRYKKLGLRWRKPKGRQSKLRVKKGGSGLLVRIGYGTKEKASPVLIYSIRDVEKAKDYGLLSSTVGAKETLKIAEQAKKLGVKILNMKKVRRAERIVKSIQKKKEAIGKSKEAGHEAAQEKSGEEQKTEDVVKENPSAVNS